MATNVLSAQQPFCTVPWTMAWISQEGTVYPCCRIEKSMAVNMDDSRTLKEIWLSDAWVDFRAKVTCSEYPYDMCRQCREAATYQTLAKDFGDVAQGYLRELSSQVLSPEEVDLSHTMAHIFTAFDYTLFTQPECVVELMSQILQDSRAWLKLSKSQNNGIWMKLITLLKVYYDFYTRNLRPGVVAPLRSPVMITRCNARCIMCPMVVDGSIERGAAMDDAVLEKSLACSEDIVKIWAASTELLLHPRWREIVARLKAAHVHLSFSTNGAPLTEASSRFLVDNRMVKQLEVSINGSTKRVYESIMRQVNFDRILDNLRFFINYNRSQGSPISLGFTMVALKSNISQLPDMIRLIHSLTGPDGSLHVSALEAPGSPKQREFYEREHPGHASKKELLRIFRKAARVAQKLNMHVTCFYYRNMEDVIHDLNAIPKVAL
jgi:MoaA/NifB/PqqE/SkfB family radical SAM enzyme